MTPRKQHINKLLQPTQSRDNPANLFVFMCVFLALRVGAEKHSSVNVAAADI